MLWSKIPQATPERTVSNTAWVSTVLPWCADAESAHTRLTLTGFVAVQSGTMVPKLVYDDSCHFCTWSTTFAVRRSNIQPVRLSEVEEGTSRLTDDERHRLPEGYEECAQLLTDEAVYSCGESMEQALQIAGVLPAELVAFLRQFETYERLREATYHFFSNNRDWLHYAIGKEPPVSRHVSEASVHPKQRPGDDV